MRCARCAQRPSLMTLENLKSAATALIAQSDLKGAIDLLFQHLHPGREAHATLVQLSARFHKALNDDHKGVLSREQSTLEYNRVSEALIHFIEGLQEQDLAGAAVAAGRPKAALQEGPVDIFIAYSRRDSTYLEELRTHLAPLERSRRVRVWYDGKIEPGAVWEEAIKIHLHGADIILLLVSADAIASDYFYDREMSDALERHHRGSARVVPLIVRPCAWKTTPLAELQALPRDGKPVTDWPVRDSAYADTVEALERMVRHIEEDRKETMAGAERRRLEAESAQRETERLRQEEIRRKQEAEAEARRREAEQQRQEEETRQATAARKEAYVQALERARTAQQNGRWADARNAWQQAQDLYEPAFPESRPALQGYIAACEKNLQRQEEYAQRIQEAAQLLRRRDWARAKAAAQAALQAQPGDAEAQRLLNEAEAGSQLPAPPQPPYLHWAGIAAGVLLAVLVILQLTKEPKQESQEELSARQYREAWQKTSEVNTIPVWEDFLNSWPDGQRQEEARRRLQERQDSFKYYLQSAGALQTVDTEAACSFLCNAQRLYPGNADAGRLRKSLRCAACE